MALLLVILVRLLVLFTVLKWRFVGALLSVAADASDVVLFEALRGLSYGGRVYRTVDKFFDTYYLSFMFYVSLSWTEPLERRASAVLCCWRLLGVLLFEITQVRQMMFLAPNIFENFYLLVTGVRKFRLDFVWTAARSS